jgi:hypothetical protein
MPSSSIGPVAASLARQLLLQRLMIHRWRTCTLSMQSRYLTISTTCSVTSYIVACNGIYTSCSITSLSSVSQVAMYSAVCMRSALPSVHFCCCFTYKVCHSDLIYQLAVLPTTTGCSDHWCSWTTRSVSCTTALRESANTFITFAIARMSAQILFCQREYFLIHYEQHRALLRTTAIERCELICRCL